MDPGFIGFVIGSVVGAVLLPIAVFLILRNLLSITPMKKWIRTVHGIAGSWAVLMTLGNLRDASGILVFPIALTTTLLFIRRSYRKAKGERPVA